MASEYIVVVDQQHFIEEPPHDTPIYHHDKEKK